jgi:hypothetical protein
MSSNSSQFTTNTLNSVYHEELYNHFLFLDINPKIMHNNFIPFAGAVLRRNHKVWVVHKNKSTSICVIMTYSSE